MVGMRKESQVENGDMVVIPAVEEICKKIVTAATHSITIKLKVYLMFIKISLFLYKLSGEKRPRMVHRYWSLADVRRIRLIIWTSTAMPVTYAFF